MNRGFPCGDQQNGTIVELLDQRGNAKRRTEREIQSRLVFLDRLRDMHDCCGRGRRLVDEQKPPLRAAGDRSRARTAGPGTGGRVLLRFVV